MKSESEAEWRLPGLDDPMPLAGVRAGISISESPDLDRLGFSAIHLRQTVIEVARYLLACGATVAYGGDLRKQGYTEALIELLVVHHRAGFRSYQRIESYLAWPYYLELEETEAAERIDEVRFIRVPPPQDLGIDPARPVGMESPEDRYARARCLAALRERMNRDVQARLLLGGQLRGLGKYPGLAEEAFLALRDGRPVFLLGAFGGCAGAVIEAVEGKAPEALTEAFQRQDGKYAAMADLWNERHGDAPFGTPEPSRIDYAALTAFFREQGIGGLHNGLSEAENRRLFETPFVPEMVRLVLKGLSALSARH